MRMLVPAIAVAGLCATLFPVSANDTMAELKTGGLVFVRSDVVQMESEDLYISPDEVRVAYVFSNVSDEDVEGIVAFPMPDVKGDPWSDIAVPDPNADNMLDFTVEVDGKPIQPDLEQRAFAVGLDITAALKSSNVSLNPFADATYAAIAALPDTIKSDWVARGIIHREMWDEGKGMEEHFVPVWSLKSTYWWRMSFPRGQRLSVRHRYRPSVGGTAGVSFIEDGKAKGEIYQEYVERYCLDDAFVRAVERHAADNPDGYPPFTENWISYVLTTGANWAGPIGKFRLVVDKVSADNLVSFCGSNVRKIGSTTFEMVADDFFPERDISILLLRPYDFERSSPAEPTDASDATDERKALKPQ